MQVSIIFTVFQHLEGNFLSLPSRQGQGEEGVLIGDEDIFLSKLA